MTGIVIDKAHSDCVARVADSVAASLGGIGLDFYEKNRPDGSYIVFEAAAPSPRIYSVVEAVNLSLEDGHIFKDRLVVSRRKAKPASRLALPETKLFRREISESLTVDKNTFGQDFLDRYTASVSNFEEIVVSNANCVVYGRRGAGKSSLLGYAMHQLRRSGGAFVWVAMQTYNGRSDYQAIASVLIEVVDSIGQLNPGAGGVTNLLAALSTLAESELSGELAYQKLLRIVPQIRSVISCVAKPAQPFTIFLDDLHLIDPMLQPYLLGVVYAASRGNSTYIKVSGIEQLCRLWDAAHKVGFQAPHDAQLLRLDYNLTMPHKSLEHIEGILDAHAKYCGLPGVRYLIEDPAISRLVLVAAAVPRDALSLFSQGISKALIKSQKMVTVTAINAAAAEAAQVKMQEVQGDLPSGDEAIRILLERVKTFCITDKRTNAFLLKIDASSSDFGVMQKLVALRLVHTLHEGLTRSRAGEGYQALMLDFGFYVGIRAAKSVNIFPSDLTQLLAKDLRKLPVFPAV